MLVGFLPAHTDVKLRDAYLMPFVHLHTCYSASETYNSFQFSQGSCLGNLNTVANQLAKAHVQQCPLRLSASNF